MIECLFIEGLAVTYTMCKEDWESRMTQKQKTDLMNRLPVPGGADVECRFVWDPFYDPKTLSPKLTDPDAITPDDIINAMLGLPAPPPGWNFPALVPYLCPLGAGSGWGCPDRPTDPFGGGSPTPGDG